MIGRPAMPRRGWPGAAVAVIAMLLVGAARAEIANRIVATIDGEPITAYEVRRFAADRGIEEADAGREALELLITERLLEKEAKAVGIAAKDEEIDRYVDEIRTRNHMSDEQFRQALTAQGITWDAYRARVKGEIEKAQLVNREIRGRVNVSPEEVRRYYDAHADDYKLRDQVRVRDILFALPGDADEDEVARVRAKAEEVRQLALDGRDFAALAKQFSEGPGADKGGELGTFTRGEMEPALDEVAFSLKRGEISQPVRTSSGFHLLRVDERIDAGQRPLDEVKDDIRDSLYNENLDGRFQHWLSHDLRERHHVEVLD